MKLIIRVGAWFILFLAAAVLFELVEFPNPDSVQLGLTFMIFGLLLYRVEV